MIKTTVFGGSSLDKILFIIRGIPGCGKSTLAKQLAEHVFEADQFFLSFGQYKFDQTKLGEAHNNCKIRLHAAMLEGISPLCVSNTTTTEKELQPYLDMASKMGYNAFVLVVENRHGGKNVHGVPDDKLASMRDRLMGSIKL